MTLPDGNVVCNGNTFEDQCTFICNTGYQLVGNSVLTCISDGGDVDGLGEWDNNTPVCHGRSKSLILSLI